MPKRSSSPQRVEARKRLRRATAISGEEELVEEAEAPNHRTTPGYQDEDEDQILPNEPQPVDQPAEDGAVMREDGSEFDSNREDSESEGDNDEVDATIDPSRKSTFSHSGILQSVELHRFMCHECFRYDLGPNVNIINGSNGSGKSAIVAAVQIGLGARANATERASKLEDHIMHGKDSAIIIIKIRNRKPPDEGGKTEADLTYKHDLYGDSVIIERKLGRGGRGSGWAVKGKKGRIKLPQGVTPAKEVNHIIDHFGFMVNNPVSILTQTKAKQFLAGRKPSDHYKLYREATLLGPLEQELERTTEALRDVRRRLARSELGLPKSKCELDKLESAYHEAQELKNIDIRIAETQLSLIWTGVEESEQHLGNMQRVTATEFEPQKEEAFQASSKFQKKIESLKEQETQESQALQEATEQSQRVLQEYRQAHREGNKLAMELDLQRKRIKNFESDALAMDRNVQHAQTKMEDSRRKHFAGQEQKSKILRDIDDLKIKEEQHGEDTRTAKLKLASVGDQAMSMGSEVSRVAGDNDRMKYHLEEKLKEQRQAEVMTRNRNSLLRFGPQVPVLERIISENENQFDRRPVGPMGQFLSLDDESWAPAVEIALGARTITTFIVHSSRDAKTLKDLFDREKRRMRRDEANRARMPAVLISNLDLQRYQIGRDDVPDVYGDGHRTVLDAVSIRNDAVFNALVDQSMIERVVLDDKNEDVTVLGWSRKPNLYMVWNKRCERAYSRNGSNTFRKAPGRNMNARYLTKDATRYLESLRDEVEKLRSDQRACESELNARRRDEMQCKSQVQDLRRQIEQAQQEMFQAQRTRARLEDQLSQAENAFDPKPFEEEIASYEEDKRQHEQGLETTRAEVSHIQNKQKEFSSEMEKAKANHVSARAQTETRSKKLSDLHNTIAKLKSKHRQLHREYDVASAKLTKAHEEIEREQTHIIEQTENARKVGARPNDIDIRKMPSEKVKRKLGGLRNKLAAEEERRGGLSAEEIEERYLLATKKYQETMQLQERIYYYEKCLKRGVRNRGLKLRELSKHLKTLVRSRFNYFLNHKGHSGSVNFSKNANGDRELHLSTRMKNHVLENGERHETKQLAALSGGEKSLTTLSFLLSMAELCQNPLRVYDEIDVYQDDATRRTTYGMLIELCSVHLAHRQIILITPCNLPEIQESPSVKVVRMADPRPDKSGLRQTRLHEFTAPSDE